MEAGVFLTSSQKWHPTTFGHTRSRIARPSAQCKPRSLHEGVNAMGHLSWLPAQLTRTIRGGLSAGVARGAPGNTQGGTGCPVTGRTVTGGILIHHSFLLPRAGPRTGPETPEQPHSSAERRGARMGVEA